MLGTICALIVLFLYGHIGVLAASDRWPALFPVKVIDAANWLEQSRTYWAVVCVSGFVTAIRGL
jgi:hypothetical protein